MANIKSAKKRIKVIARQTEEHRVIKSALKTQVKKFKSAASSGEENLDTLYNETVSKVDKAVTKGIIHKNKAAHTKAQLADMLNK